ncbi:MAG: 50S ribosomal protein L18e [Candidatus Nanohaloarchaeota archaeon QJJ-7]|nr:50S ribosomal protein L18e [Candidatus Nanohaloarchaeota archaeon QJJ-7]
MTDLEQKTNPVLKEAIRKCEEAGRRNDAKIWDIVAEELEKANRKVREVNVSTIEREADDGDTVVVPGKVMGSGHMTEDITVGAFKFTDGALETINESGEAVYLEELVDENPDGEGVILLG